MVLELARKILILFTDSRPKWMSVISHSAQNVTILEMFGWWKCSVRKFQTNFFGNRVKPPVDGCKSQQVGTRWTDFSEFFCYPVVIKNSKSYQVGTRRTTGRVDSNVNLVPLWLVFTMFTWTINFFKKSYHMFFFFTIKFWLLAIRILRSSETLPEQSSRTPQ